MKYLPYAAGDREPNKDLSLLLKEKGSICVSVIVPTHPILPDWGTDRLRLETTIQVAKENLRFTCRGADVDPLLHNIDHLFNRVDFSHNQEGLGLFISPGLQLQVKFPFPVTGKVTVAESFELRDVFYKLSYSLPYYVLYLREEKARLFDALLLNLKEIKDKNFPVSFTAEEDDPDLTANGSSGNRYAFLNGAGPDREKLKKLRHQSFIQMVDGLLREYIKDQTHLIVCGPKNSLSHFMNFTGHVDQLAGIVSCDNDLKEVELAGKAWFAFRSFLEEKKREAISEYEEKVAEGLAECGLPSVWQAVSEGRGLKLLVEKDFRRAGFVKKEDSSAICLHPPRVPYKTLPDAVDDLIAMVLDQNGEVVFVENGQLSDQQHIALITRQE